MNQAEIDRIRELFIDTYDGSSSSDRLFCRYKELVSNIPALLTALKLKIESADNWQRAFEKMKENRDKWSARAIVREKALRRFYDMGSSELRCSYCFYYATHDGCNSERPCSNGSEWAFADLRFVETEIQGEQILNRSVNELKLSARVRRLINYRSIGTVGELIQWSEAGLLKLKFFGRKTVNEIKNELSRFGLALRM
jgi:hypothetical protein